MALLDARQHHSLGSTSRACAGAATSCKRIVSWAGAPLKLNSMLRARERRFLYMLLYNVWLGHAVVHRTCAKETVAGRGEKFIKFQHSRDTSLDDGCIAASYGWCNRNASIRCQGDCGWKTSRGG